ncbi:hypothetical protein T459_35035 [Capsicum annuum]|uniref:Uncharacterized protein n=1 Tax=Capsicum annuum TaxID=4072 RepID=A0A2G2XUG8_CAPAN|nr:hypothetical protein T459_35035 [Capsicum annuum]
MDVKQLQDDLAATFRVRIGATIFFLSMRWRYGLHIFCPNIHRVLWTLYSYALVAFVLLGAAISWHLLVTDPLAARRHALQSTVIRLREGFRRKDHNSSASSSEGCGSSVKRSSSANAGHLGNATVPCTGDGST